MGEIDELLYAGASRVHGRTAGVDRGPNELLYASSSSRMARGELGVAGHGFLRERELRKEKKERRRTTGRRAAAQRRRQPVATAGGECPVRAPSFRLPLAS